MIHDLTLGNYTGVIISNALTATLGPGVKGSHHGEQRVPLRY